MLNREEMRVLIEREGISEFFNVVDSVFLEEAQCTLYELDTDYYAVIFRIFPSPYAGEGTEAMISSAVTSGLPVSSVVQFHQISTRNLSDHRKGYDQVIVDDVDSLNLDSPHVLQELHQAHLDFLDEHVDTTVFEKTRLAFYLRDFVNTVTVLFPMRDESEKQRSPQDLVPFISRFKGTLHSMSPQNVNEHQYIRIMRELLAPYNPLPDAYRDPSVDIRDHFTDNNSILVDEGNGVIKLGTSLDINFDKQDGVVREKKAGFFKRVKRKFFSFEEEEVESENKKESDAYFVKVLSKKIFPEYADLHSITNITMDYFNMNVQQQIPLPYVVALSIKIENSEKVIDSVKEAARWNKWQLENVGRLASFLPELQMRAEEADNIINIIDRHGDVPMKAQWSMLLYSKNKADLEYNTSIVKAAFQSKSFHIQEEDLIATNMFMYSLPMKYDEIYREFSKRFQTIFKSNVAAIVPLGTDSRGFGSEPVIQLFGRNGQPQSFDLYDRNAANKNAVIIAPTGKGKSFFTQRLVWSYLKMDAKIRIIDSGHSYKSLCNYIGGQYITFPEENDICINPFSDARLDLDGNLHEDEVSNITGLIGIMAGYDLGETSNNIDAEIVNTLTSYISTAVVNAYVVGQENTGLFHVGEALRAILKNTREDARVSGDIRDSDIDRRLPGLITSLQDFTNINGIYYSYVNGPSTISFEKNLVVLDLDDLSGKQKRFRDFVLSTVTNAIEREFYRDSADKTKKQQRKIFLIDEAWNLLDGKAGGTIAGLYRRARKMKGSIITITQSINDFYLNDYIKTIFENAYWRLFLQQDESVMQTAMDEGKLVIDPYAFELLKSVETIIGEYSEVMVMTQVGELMIGRTLATRVEYWISTQDERDVNRVLEVMEFFGVDETIARTAIGKSETNNTTAEEEITKILGFEDLAVDELLEDEAS